MKAMAFAVCLAWSVAPEVINPSPSPSPKKGGEEGSRGFSPPSLLGKGAGGLGPIALRADDDSGPKAGEKVAKLKAFGVVGKVESKEVDFAAERKDAPTIYLFVAAQEGGIPVGGRPAARFMKKLDEEVSKIDGAAVVA